MTSPAPLSSPCRAPGCPELLPSSGYCDAHRHRDPKTRYDATRRKEDPALALAAKIRSSTQWQSVRAQHRRENPLCSDPFAAHPDRPTPSTQSHHIEPLASRPDLAFTLSNLAPLCTACHARVERIERHGAPTAPLFSNWVATPRHGGGMGNLPHLG